MSGIGIKPLTSNNYITTSKETQPNLCLKTDAISVDKIIEKDSFKSELFDKKPLNEIKAKPELGFVDIEINNSPPASVAKANITEYNPEKHVSSKNANFFYVNGIMTGYDDAKKTASILSEIMGKPVLSILSKSEGVLGDLIKTVKIDQENSMGNISSETFKDITTCIIYSLNTGKNVKLIAHSRGATETANSLWDVRSRLAISGRTEEDINKLMSRIEVITMGGVATPSDFPSDVKLTQIKNPDDPVPKLNSARLSLYSNNERPIRYSRFENLLRLKTMENNGNPLSPAEKQSLYKEIIDDSQIATSTNIISIDTIAKAKSAMSIFSSDLESERKKQPRFGFSTFPFTFPTFALHYFMKDLKATGVTLEKLVSSHLINAGSNNYLGEENVQKLLIKVSND